MSKSERSEEKREFFAKVEAALLDPVPAYAQMSISTLALGVADIVWRDKQGIANVKEVVGWIDWVTTYRNYFGCVVLEIVSDTEEGVLDG